MLGGWSAEFAHLAWSAMLGGISGVGFTKGQSAILSNSKDATCYKLC